MKKLLSLIMALTIILSLASVVSFAKGYTEFNIVFEEKDGEKVYATKITVLASVDNGSLVDRTNEFTMEGVAWFKYLPEPEAGKTADDYDYVDEELKVYGMMCTEDDVFDHEHYSYFLRIARLYAQEEDSFDRNVKINGVDIDELNGSCYNTGSEFYIKTITNGQGGSSEEETETTEVPADNGETSDEDTDAKKSKCKVCGICPIQPLGICLFIWIAIILLIIVIIAVVIFIVKKKSEKKDDKEEEKDDNK